MLAQLTTWIKFLTPVLTLGIMVFYLDREKYPVVDKLIPYYFALVFIYTLLIAIEAI